MTEFEVGHPRGTLMVELAGRGVVEAESVNFHAGSRGVPPGKVYVGPNYDKYEMGVSLPAEGIVTSHEDLGTVKPGHGANRVVVHGYRHTDWIKGPWAKFKSGVAHIRNTSWPDRPDVVKWGINSLGSINATHDEHARTEHVGTDMDVAADSLDGGDFL